ncbi:ectoine synthase [Pseudonocardia lacus]|uniref:ectoine synthase n=1 Tax=Pseudonocardia lacus TaxID=2835865 RepID=UPI001BDC1FA0|nr:ectoine synthase [Pseudonocardia lacus]
MIVRTLNEITGTERDVQAGGWRSRRLLLAGDGVGFSLHETVLEPGSVHDFWYAHHVEAVLVVEGDGELLDKDAGRTHQLGPGSLYVLDGHEHHQLRPRTRMRTVCVFNPPVTGREVHDEHGAYPPPAVPARGEAGR